MPASPTSIPPHRQALTWDEVHRDARALAVKLAQAGPFAALIAVTRGGLVPAAIIARELDMRLIDTLCIASYDGTRRGPLEVLKTAQAAICAQANPGQRLLIVDDLADTGATLRRARELVAHAHVATLYAKPEGMSAVDTFVTSFAQTTWIDFPWDAPPDIGSGGKG